MLNTINGFDFLLVLVIAGMYLKIYNLNQECESYVEQIIDIARDNYELSQLKYPHMDDAYVDSLLSTEGSPLSCQFTGECNCKNCYIRVKPPKELIPKCTAPDPMLCDCDDCWVIPTKYF